jgi:hypothetical protein
LGICSKRKVSLNTKAAYQQAIGSTGSTTAESVAAALGDPLREQGEIEGAMAAYQLTIDLP